MVGWPTTDRGLCHNLMSYEWPGLQDCPVDCSNGPH
jgi:hypothetical protein